jgi:hypothetical protein
MKQTATFVMLAILFGQAIQANGQTPKPLTKAHDTFMMSYMNARSAYQEGLAKALLSVDRAEVFLLDFDITNNEERSYGLNCGFAVIPGTKFPIYAMGTTADIKEQKRASPDESKRIGIAFSAAVQESKLSEDYCHFPIHGLRLYQGSELILETSICWTCHTFVMIYPNCSDLMKFQSEPLFDILTRIMPIPESETVRFKAKYPNQFRTK